MKTGAKKKPTRRRQWNSTLNARKSPLRGTKGLAKGKPRGGGKRKGTKLSHWPTVKQPSKGRREWFRVYGSEARVAWVARSPSVVSGKLGCENCHVTTGGMGRKADACWIVPLTPAEHRELHQHGTATFEAKYGVDLKVEAAKIDAAWRSLTETQG